MTTDIRQAIMMVVGEIDREIADLQTMREAQMAILDRYETAVSAPTKGRGGELTTSAPQTGAPTAGETSAQAQQAPAATASAPAPAIPGGTTGTRGSKRAAKSAPTGGTRRGAPARKPKATADSKGDSRSAPEVKEQQTPTGTARKPRGTNAQSAASKPGTKPRGTTSAAAPAAPPTPPPSAAPNRQQTITSPREISPEIWPTLLGPRGKSARDLARAATRQMNVNADRDMINKIAESASTILEELVTNGGAKAHGEGAARVFSRE